MFMKKKKTYQEISGFTFRKLSNVIALNDINTKVRNQITRSNNLQKIPPRRLINVSVNCGNKRNFFFFRLVINKRLIH